jgi:eukaryotic-like serine/threonine-protein kinase
MTTEPSQRHPIDRLADDFLARYRAGERPSVSEYARRYPELADQLQEVLQALVLLEELAPGKESAGDGDAARVPAEGPPPRRLGEYRIVREVGRGGMGVVYEAEQESLGRRVALKVLPFHALMEPLHLERFRREAKAAARLHHTNIVPVFGVGQEGGVHYYAMQFIDGQGLDQVLAELRRLREAKETPARTPAPAAVTRAEHSGITALSETPSQYFRGVARLGVQAAEALAHAHAQGVLHRDVKPSNLLLDAQGTVWVTDFGLAKAEGLDDLTQTGDLVGTLRYLAPERLEGWADPRSDVYGLGLTLYELLTLRPAFDGPDRKRLLEQVTAREPTAPRRLDGRIPRDLETVVLKAVAREPGQRYRSAAELAEDLRRFLADRPVAARRSSWREQAWRWCRRKPAAAGLLGVIPLALLTLLLISLAYNVRLEQRRAEAETAHQREAAERERAEQEKQIAEAVRGFLQRKLLGLADLRTQANALLRAGAASDQAKRNPTIGELLDRAAAELAPDKIEAQFPRQPLAQAAILQTLGETYWGIGAYPAAVAHLTRAHDLWQRGLGPDHPDTLKALHSLAKACWSAGRRTEAIQFFEQARDKRTEVLGPDHRDTLTTLENLALAYGSSGKLPDALRLHEQVRDKRLETLGPDHPDTLSALENLALAYREAGRVPEAIRLYEQVRDQRVALLGPSHPDTLDTLHSLALAYRFAGRLPEAIRLNEQVRDEKIKRLGPDHPDTLGTLHNLALAYRAAGRLTEAIRLYEQVRDKMAQTLGPDHPDTLTALHNLAAAYSAAKQLDRSVPLFEEVVAKDRARLGPDHPETLNAMANLAVIYRNAGRLPEAVPLLEEALARFRKLPAPTPVILAWLPRELAQMYDQAGQYAKSEPLHREVLDQARRQYGTRDAYTAGAMIPVAGSLLNQKRHAEAEPLLRESLAIREETQPDDWTTFNTKSLLGVALMGQRRWAEAEPLLVAGYEGMKKDAEKNAGNYRPGSSQRLRLTQALERIVHLYDATGRKDEADRWRNELGKGKAARPAGPPKEKSP